MMLSPSWQIEILCLVHHALRVSLFLPATIPCIASVHATYTSAASHVDGVSYAETVPITAGVQTSQSVSNTREWPIIDFKPLDNPPKYFAVDIDRTFRATDPEAMKRNLDAFEKALNTGYDLFFCTGRGMDLSLLVVPDEVRERIGFTGYPGIYHNGALVYGTDGRILRHAHFPVDILSCIVKRIQAAKHEKSTVFMAGNDWHVLTKHKEYVDGFAGDFGRKNPIFVSKVEDLNDAKITMIVILQYDRVYESFKDMDGKHFASKPIRNNSVEISPIGVNKGNGLEILMSELDIDSSDCGYVGDGDNDIEAMEMVEHSFAVGNANDAVKAVAKYVVQQTNEEAAFATVMNAVYGIDEE